MLYFSYPDELQNINNAYCKLYSFNFQNISFRSDVVENENTAGKSVELAEQKLMPEKFQIAYPFIPNQEQDPVKTKINKLIVDEVSKLFATQVLLPESTDFDEIFGSYEVTLNEKGLLSILFSMYTYVHHAAHGYTAYSSLTVDTETGEAYSFNELFSSKIYYVGILSEIAKKYIKDNEVPLIAEYNGITPNQQFYLTPDSLVLYYQVYEYTPYVYGLFRIPVPYSEIRNLLGPASPINKLL